MTLTRRAVSVAALPVFLALGLGACSSSHSTASDGGDHPATGGSGAGGGGAGGTGLSDAGTAGGGTSEAGVSTNRACMNGYVDETGPPAAGQQYPCPPDPSICEPT